jgi:hypothetical protein
MKKFTAILTMVLLLGIFGFANAANMTVKKVFSSTATAAGGTSTSSSIHLGSDADKGHFSLQITATGDGTAKIEALTSNDGSTFVIPLDSSGVRLPAIITGFTKTGGPGSDGKDIFQFTLPIARYLKLKITETGAANSITFDAWLLIQ